MLLSTNQNQICFNTLNDYDIYTDSQGLRSKQIDVTIKKCVN